MSERRRSRWAAVGLVALLATVHARAQDAPPEPPRRAVGEQMRRLFAARLKADVGLDDAHVRRMLPEIEALERTRREAQRDRLALMRELRRGLDAGADDASLQRKLEALDRSAELQASATREALGRLDADLTVAQRVRLRLLLGTFRTEMTRRVDEFRSRRAPPPPPAP